jgi:hypothetical protein
MYFVIGHSVFDIGYSSLKLIAMVEPGGTKGLDDWMNGKQTEGGGRRAEDRGRRTGNQRSVIRGQMKTTRISNGISDA